METNYNALQLKVILANGTEFCTNWYNPLDFKWLEDLSLLLEMGFDVTIHQADIVENY